MCVAPHFVFIVDQFCFFYFQEHEKTCQEDDDVIFCGEELPPDPIDRELQEQTSFLHNFGLFNSNFPLSSLPKTPIKKNNNHEPPLSPNSKFRRQPHRSRFKLNLSNLPFSSPAGQQLIKLSKSTLADGYIQDKLDRTDRYCCAPSLGSDSINRPKFMCPSTKWNRTPVTFRRPQDCTYRWYTFPRRQNNQIWRRQAFLNLNINELKICRPVCVKLKKLTSSQIEAFHLENSYKKMIRLGQLRKCPDDENDRSNIVDVIDLCSSDDEDDRTNDFTDSPLNHDIENISQTAITPASNKSPIITEPMYNKTSSQATMSMCNPDDNYQYQNQENHRSFLNGAQGSIVMPNGKLIFDHNETLMQTISSINSDHMSIDLT